MADGRSHSIDVRFWGVRGSIPTPGPATAEIGGNTSCVEVRAGDRLIVFDAGTGLRMLGNALLKELGRNPIEAWIFFSHVHWDHIQGFPFFTPAFIRGNTIHLFGGHKAAGTLEETLAGQMENPSFPVHLSDMGAKMHFHDVFEGEVVEIPAPHGSQGAPIKISNTRGNHPNGVYAYRVDWNGKSVMYATDTEHYAVVDPKLRRLAQGVDVLIYDSQYTPEEYAGQTGGGPKTGWGHSTFEAAVDLAKAAAAKTLVLYHHDPGQDDKAVRDKERRAKELFPNAIAAYEGLTISV